MMSTMTIFCDAVFPNSSFSCYENRLFWAPNCLSLLLRGISTDVFFFNVSGSVLLSFKSKSTWSFMKSDAVDLIGCPSALEGL